MTKHPGLPGIGSLIRSLKLAYALLKPSRHNPKEVFMRKPNPVFTAMSASEFADFSTVILLADEAGVSRLTVAEDFFPHLTPAEIRERVVLAGRELARGE